MKMIITLDDYRCKLINRILFASSLTEVKRFIDTAMKSLKTPKLHDHTIARFAEKTIKSLEEFQTEDNDMQQWANVQYAKLELDKIFGTVHTDIKV